MGAKTVIKRCFGTDSVLFGFSAGCTPKLNLLCSDATWASYCARKTKVLMETEHFSEKVGHKLCNTVGLELKRLLNKAIS